MMNINTVMTGNLTPFDFDVEEEIQKLLEDKDCNILIPIKLFCVFFEKLVHGDIELHFQSVNLLNIKVDYAAKNSCRSSLVNVMEGIGGELWEAFINWSSFQKEFIDLSVAETVMDVDSEDLLSWDDTVRADYISKYQKQLFTKIQTGLFGEIPGPVLDFLDFPYGRAAIYLYSEKIIKYLEFAADNKDIIHNQFAREHERIRRALRIVEQPVAREWVKSHVKKGRYFIIGFYIGEDIEHGITFRNLNWNFFVALYVLEKLLEIADSFFHFYEER